MNIIIGNITFVEPEQNDYDDLYIEFGVDNLDLYEDKNQFCIVNSIVEIKPYNEETLKEIDDNGHDYLVPEKYNGYIIWNHEK